MSAEEVLSAREQAALTAGEENNIVSRVTGKKSWGKNRKWSFGAVGLVTALLVLLLVVVTSGSLIPAAILERLVEATDVQYADAVESKILVFQQAMQNDEIPENTIKRLQANGFTVENGGKTLIYDGEMITAGNFVDKVHSSGAIYNAFNAATYDRAAYYYDEAAEEVFKKIGTSRNNYTASSEFNTVMSSLVGEGSDVNVSNVGLVEKTNDKGETYTEYDIVGDRASSGGGSASDYINTIAENILAKDSFTATMEATDALNTADTISKEEKSSIFFMALMENISKMKAGDGNTSKINDAMNFLYKVQESSVVDINTGETVTVKGSMLESPSLYAILAGEKINATSVENYASDRVLKTVENRVGASSIGSDVRDGTITSTGNKSKGTIGRFLPDLFGETADTGVLSSVTETINSSMMDNGFGTIGGIYGGELLVEGAVNVGKMLAKSSGGAAGDAAAAQSYARLNETILALDAEADRLNRSPFDITSKNTFLGSIVYKLGISVRYNNSILSGVASTIGSIMSGMMTKTYAADAGTQYLNNFGDCERINSIGAVGSVGCSEVATFDTSTLKDPFNDAGFTAFVEENTTLSGGTREVKEDSDLANFIKYNDERITPIGVMDGGILEAIKNSSSKVSFISSIITMIKTWLLSTDEDKAMATGKSFVNSSSNAEWEEKYKYAQRYVSLARATSALRQYDGDETAYNNLKYFEGSENPVMAYLNKYYSNVANK